MTIAREAAALSVTSLRFDRRGVGDSGPIDADNPTSVYSHAADEDARTAVAALGADPRNLVMTGLCSGAWTSASMALQMGARSTILVNMILWSVRRKKSLMDAVLPEAPRIDPGAETTKLPLRGRVKGVLQSRLPYPAWKLLGIRGITQVPEVMLEALCKRGVDTTVILSPADAAWFNQQRGPEGVARMTHRGQTFNAIMPPVGDHPSYHRDLRNIVQTKTISSIAKAFGIATAPRAHTANANRFIA